jgi:hypothetical protein
MNAYPAALTARMDRHFPPPVCGLNFPIGMNAGLAKAIGVMMKLDFERAVLNRIPHIEANSDRHYRQVLFLCDEYQHFTTVGESDPTGDERFNLQTDVRDYTWGISSIRCSFAIATFACIDMATTRFRISTECLPVI